MSTIRWKTWMILLLAALLATALAGCSGTNKNDGQTASPASSPSGSPADTSAGGDLPIIGTNLKYDPNAPVNENKPITVKFWYPEDVKGIVEKFTALYTELHPNVTFDTNVSPWDDYWTKLPIAIHGGTGPDLYWMHNAYTDTMVPITEPLPEEVFPIADLKADFMQIDQHLIDNKLYYIDTGLMSSIMMYNKAMWREAGLSETDFPTTWDELRETAKKLTKTDGAGNIIVSGFSFNGESNFANLITAMDYQKGIFTYSEDGKKSLYNNPTTIENMEYLKSWYTVDKVGDNKGALNREALGQGRAAMINDWTWVPGYLKDTFPDIEVGYFPTPSFDGNPAAFDRNNGESSPSVSAKASPEAKAAAFDFVKYLLAGDDFIREFALSNGIFPAKRSLADDPDIAASPVHQTLKQIIDKTVWPGPTPAVVESTVQKYLQDDFLKNNVSSADAAAKTDEVLAKDLGNLTFVPVERRYEGASQFKN